MTLGENGTGLSGGQKTRVNIARAFLQEVPIMLMDDPFSSLDATATANVFRACKDNTQNNNQTVLIVTH